MERCYGSIGTTGGLGLDTADEIYLSGTAWFIAVQLSPDPSDQVFWGGGSSAVNQTAGTGQRSSLARMGSADLVQRKGLGLALCSAR